MKNKQYKFNTGTFHLYDSTTMPYEASNNAAHFALTDALIEYAGAHQQPMIHFWQTAPLVILGMMDTKIGNFDQAIQLFEQYNHDYIIRNSGGLAVVSDPGVLNVSLIYPSAKEYGISIDQAYELMLDFIRQTFYLRFPDKKIEAYEIEHSYCFGDYDLSIDGQKIAGISQRRIKEGVAIMLYVSINGDQQQRAKMLQDFYSVGLDGSERAGRYPSVKPEVMTTLQDAYQHTLSVEEVKEMMLSHFNWSEGKYNSEIEESFDEALAKMYKRNRRFLGEDFI